MLAYASARNQTRQIFRTSFEAKHGKAKHGQGRVGGGGPALLVFTAAGGVSVRGGVLLPSLSSLLFFCAPGKRTIS